MKDPRSRITPAHAGTSLALLSRLVSPKDHPRTRGDKNRYIPYQQIFKGSPPHTRGQAFRRTECKTFPGITPAHAGTSLSIHYRFHQA